MPKSGNLSRMGTSNYRYTVILRPAQGKWPHPDYRPQVSLNKEERKEKLNRNAKEKRQMLKEARLCFRCKGPAQTVHPSALLVWR